MSNRELSWVAETPGAMKMTGTEQVGEIAQLIAKVYRLHGVIGFEGIPNTDPGVTLFKSKDAKFNLKFRNGDRRPINFFNVVESTENAVVSFNYALNGAEQNNSSYGPGSGVRNNRAEGPGTKQTNKAVSVICLMM
ncbi:hypothetical protein Daesc_007962 [Daldinia eschscholtzii]|uniref:Uncharacterized protein n=1 Tax=Daldinia eschscholtzii TaxID=292717 RepID=A0AAX6MG79_9PEZI